MADGIVAAVEQLWRYPVKSMVGERLQIAAITERGLLGDRALALRDLRSGHLVSAKKYPAMLTLRAGYRTPPTADDPGRIGIELPADGKRGAASIDADHPKAAAILSDILGFAVAIERTPATEREEIAIDPPTIFGDIPAHEILRGLEPGKSLLPTFRAPRGTFFDAAPVHLLASGTLDHLSELEGLGAPAIDPRRFRPNLFLRTAAGVRGFIEDQWLAGTLAIGAVRIESLKPTLRCVMIAHAQQGLPRDPGLLRAAAAHHGALVGITGRIASGGVVRVGDAVSLLPG